MNILAFSFLPVPLRELLDSPSFKLLATILKLSFGLLFDIKADKTYNRVAETTLKPG